MVKCVDLTPTGPRRRFKIAMEKDTQIKESLERIVERLKWSNV